MNNSNKPLLQILVEELPKRGGWPEGALNATQDKDGEVCFSDGAVPEFGLAAWEGGNWCGNEFYTITAIDYATAIITRDQFEAALAASKAVVGHNGWIDWHGGECPVEESSLVEVQYRNEKAIHIKGVVEAGQLCWSHDNSDGDIIAYRLHQPKEAEQDESCDEADMNDCVGQAVPVPARCPLLADIHAAGIKIDLESAVFLADYLIDAGYRKQ